MYWGWRGRAKRQADRVGALPPVPATLGAPTVPPVTGLYVGSTLAPSWQDRIAVGDLGYRAAGELTRFASGILLDRDGASPIWIPDESIRAIRTERGLAGKVMTKDGVLVIRWELPTGTEIDTGFRADDKSAYPGWVEGDPRRRSGQPDDSAVPDDTAPDNTVPSNTETGTQQNGDKQ
nr:transporter [Rhodococcus sp. HNM0569]